MPNLLTIVICLSMGFVPYLQSNDSGNPTASKTTQCDNLDSIFNQLVKSKKDTVFLYEEQNFTSGFRGLIIWTQSGVLNGIKLIHDERGGFKKKESLQDFKALNSAFVQYFENIGKIDSLRKNNIETLHDFNIRIRSFFNGRFNEFLFTDAQRFNNPTLLARISLLCQEEIIK